MQEYTLKQYRWRGEKEVTIGVPDDWKVHYAAMEGDDYKPLSYEELREIVRHPYASKTLRELAAERENAIILFENTSRGADTVSMAHIVVEELLAGGMKKENIVFFCACATHGPLDFDDFVQKLGADIVEEYEVYNHNCWQNFKYLGTSVRGNEINVSAEVMEYDLKIGLGGLVPHPTAGFGGGCKIVLPGVTSIETIAKNHKGTLGNLHKRTLSMVDMVGNMQNKDIREECEEVAQMMGLDFIINTMYNTKTETVDAVAGQPLVAYYEGVKRGRHIYNTEHFEKVDVCIANGNAKLNENGISKMVAEDCIKEGGDIVIINHCETGNVNHYLCNMWGRHYGGYMSNPKAMHVLPYVRKFIIYSPYKYKTCAQIYGDSTIWCKTWEEVLEQLSDRGPGTTCAVWPDSTLQFYADDFKFDFEPVNYINYLKEHQ